MKVFINVIIPKAMGFAGDLFSEKAGKLNRFGYIKSNRRRVGMVVLSL